MTPTLTARLDAAARLRLDRSMDALLAVIRADNLCALTDNNSRYPYDATWRGRVYAEFG